MRMSIFCLLFGSLALGQLAAAQPSPAPHPAMPAWFNCTEGTAKLSVSFGEQIVVDCGTRLFKCPESPTQTEPLVRLAEADPTGAPSCCRSKELWIDM